MATTSMQVSPIQGNKASEKHYLLQEVCHELQHLEIIVRKESIEHAEVISGVIHAITEVGRGDDQNDPAFLEEIQTLLIRIPSGLRRKMKNLDRILEEFHDHVFKYRFKNKEFDLQDPLLKQFVTSWRAGEIGIKFLFMKIQQAVNLDQITMQRANNIINYVMKQGGHQISKAYTEQCRRQKIELKNVDMFDLKHTSTERYQTNFQIKSMNLQCTVDNSNVAPVITYKLQSLERCKGISWQYSRNHRGVSCMKCDLDSTSDTENSSSPRSINGHNDTIQQPYHLVIGSSISYHNGELDVDDIVAIDLIRLDHDSNTIISIVLLVEGKWSIASNLDNSATFKSSFCDGTSDYGDDDDAMNTSGGSGADDSIISKAVAMIAIKPRFYAVFVHVSRSGTQIESITPIHNSLSLDQIPAGVSMLNKFSAIVYGTHGLLAMVYPITSHEYLIWETASDIHKCGKFTHSLNGDSLEAIADRPVIHEEEANLTTVQYHEPSMSLASGDNMGKFAIWKVTKGNQFGGVHLRSSSTLSIMLHSHIFKCAFTPYGDAVVVLKDRLLVVSPNQDQNLYVRSIIDSVEGHRAHYSISCDADYIHVWRFTPGDPITAFSFPENQNIEANMCNLSSTDTLSNDLPAEGDLLPISAPTTVLLTWSHPTPSSPLVLNATAGLPFEHYRQHPSPTVSEGMTTCETRLGSVANSFRCSPTAPPSAESPRHPLVVLRNPPTKREYGFPMIESTQLNVEMHESSEVNNRSLFHRFMIAHFKDEQNELYCSSAPIIAICMASFQYPTIGIISSALDVEAEPIHALLKSTALSKILRLRCNEDHDEVNHMSDIVVEPCNVGLLEWLSIDRRASEEFWIDPSIGHNYLCALYLKFCGNKSVAVECPWQEYLRTYGPLHLRRTSRGLRQLTTNIRKLDETANIKDYLPRQIGFISGLQEIYARRVGLKGRIPFELGYLSQLRVLSMGNNQLCGELPTSLTRLKNLQRIVLHQNRLSGIVPRDLGDLGCIVNLAGNPNLEYGDDVPDSERDALIDLFNSTRGGRWNTKTNWCSNEPVCKWYKVGVLSSHVHSIVMSSNGMEGRIPSTIFKLGRLRMIELATMPGLLGPLPSQICLLTSLRRLCICRCGLTGRIPDDIGKLVALEELQLFGNHLTGTIPPSIGQLTGLKLLSLGEYTGGNDFAVSAMPSCLSTLTNLEALFMANCNLKSSIPTWIGRLTELRQLDLQRNRFTGSVPRSVGLLTNLLYLNLKDNESLGGSLPLDEMISLTRLNRLSLVHCNFEDIDTASETLQRHLPRCKIWM